MKVLRSIFPLAALLVLATCNDSKKNAPTLNYTVTFDSRGGSDVASATVEQGKTVSRPADPTQQGSAFSGWYTDNGSFQNKFNFDKPITADITLYAKYDETVYLVSTEEQLREVGKDLAGLYRLQNDITLTQPWTPIGTLSGPTAGDENAFNGHFYGQGHVIHNLNISNGGSYTGLFGAVGKNGVVQDVGIEVRDIKARNTISDSDVGALVGYNRGAVSGYALGGTLDAPFRAGGLVGNNAGGTVIGYATVAVSGDFAVGGLVGQNTGGHVYGYATAEVKGVGTVGGLVGQNYVPGVIMGYARNKVTPLLPGRNSIDFGLLVGLLSTTLQTAIQNDDVKGYHSMNESQFTNFDASKRVVSNTATLDGASITVDANTQQSVFNHLDFTADGQWIFKAGYWPSIRFVTPVNQDAATKP